MDVLILLLICSHNEITLSLISVYKLDFFICFFLAHTAKVIIMGWIALIFIAIIAALVIFVIKQRDSMDVMKFIELLYKDNDDTRR
ncbi:hypothetical protein SAMN05192562_101409 [Kosakonia arachidis]|uniref:Uncharacterized protein n=1 Tax=Kosakonia arachidis TaxID=551989 RepID=A0A1I6Y9Y1_9ENTR|nr:hypothetical protein SAMN05192562_101409 [Kosakonia arachidis]